VGGIQVIRRGGGPIRDGSSSIGCAEKDCMSGTILDVTGDFCCCNTNLCNSAERITMTVSIFLTILFFILPY
jgi:hypothetical protein